MSTEGQIGMFSGGEGGALEPDVRQAEAVAGLAGLAGGSVHAVITDPPYCSAGLSETGRLRQRGQGLRDGDQNDLGWFDGDNMGSGGLCHLMRLVAVESNRCLVPGGSLVVFCDWRMHANLVPAIESAGLLHRGLIVWDKGSMGLGNGFRPRHELAMHFSKGKLAHYARDVPNVIQAKRVHVSRRTHPCEKPVDLLAPIVRVTTPEGGLVVDPFAGSGATVRAALAEGREFIGFDVSERFARSPGAEKA